MGWDGPWYGTAALLWPLFWIILDAGISSINDLSSFKVIEHIHHLFVQAQSLTPDERDTMGRLTQLLIDTRYQAWKIVKIRKVNESPDSLAFLEKKCQKSDPKS